jgi:serine/threonine-protein kinase
MLIPLALLGGLGIFFFSRNLRAGRGDRRGALRLVATVGVLDLSALLLNAHYSGGGSALAVLLLATRHAVTVSVTAWFFYIALEPDVRRRWPRTLISWSRLLAGRWRDPLVGRDTLIGTLAGLAMGLLGTAGFLGRVALGSPETLVPRDWSPLPGAASALSAFFDGAYYAPLLPMALLFFLFVLRVGLRGDRAAVGVFIGLLLLDKFSRLSVPAVGVPLALLEVALTVFVLVRVGLLALSVSRLAFFLGHGLSLQFPDFLGSEVGLSLAVLLLLSAGACWVSLGRRSTARSSDLSG